MPPILRNIPIGKGASLRWGMLASGGDGGGMGERFVWIELGRLCSPPAFFFVVSNLTLATDFARVYVMISRSALNPPQNMLGFIFRHNIQRQVYAFIQRRHKIANTLFSRSLTQVQNPNTGKKPGMTRAPSSRWTSPSSKPPSPNPNKQAPTCPNTSPT